MFPFKWFPLPARMLSIKQIWCSCLKYLHSLRGYLCYVTNFYDQIDKIHPTEIPGWLQLHLSFR